MKRFVHIGYPKNFSTSLQRNFFPVHDEIVHLGIGPGIDYADPLTDAVFEVYLKSAKSFSYKEQEARLKKHFADVFRKAENSGRKVITASSEHLSFAFANDSLDFEEKMKRLSDLFGNETGIILIIRNQLDLIRSLYRESVRVGFPGSFSEYAYLLFKYRDRNYCYDFRYDLTCDVLCRYFDRSNIHILLFEDMRRNGELVMNEGRVLLLEKLCSILGVHYMDIDFGHFNEALADAVVKRKSELNETNRHDLGNILYETAEKHRMKSYLFHELNLFETEEKLYEDVRMKRELIARATSEAEGMKEKTDYSVDPQVASWLRNFYEEGNKRLADLAGIQLPSNYFELKF